MLSGSVQRHARRENVHSRSIRLDIEGLRAVAVLSVVLFHVKVPAFRGGFSGVDIFFVISGYLITKNILADIQSGQFTFRDFYVRRVRRIFPGMLAAVAVTLIFGALWFPPEAFIELAKSSFSSLAFIANIHFWWDAQQYFSSNSDYLPLLHLWSLSVEEQFYIVWPLVILIISRARGRTLTLLIGALVAVSLFATFAIARFDKSSAFYLMPFRVYQLGLGALVVRIEHSVSSLEVNTQRVMQGLGLALCAFGIFAFGSNSQFPSVTSSLGAALTIYAGYAGVSNPLLTNSVAGVIGRLSYSLYLVHWPVVVFANYVFGGEAFSSAGLLLQMTIMLMLASLMHWFIELPFLRQSGVPLRTRPIRPLIAASAALVAISIVVIAGGGWNWRLGSAQQSINKLEAFGVFPCMRDRASCIFGAPAGKIAAILVGDSYAQHYVAAIDKIAGTLGLRVEEHIQGGCLVLEGLLRLGYPDDRCRTGRDRILATTKRSIAPVIISQAWMGYLDGSIGDDNGRPIDVRSEERRLDVLRLALERTIDEIARPDRRVLLIGAQVLAPCEFAAARLGEGPLPHARNPPCAPQLLESARRATKGVNDMLASVQAKYPGVVSVLIPEDYMCEAVCPTVRDGVWLYQDAGHLTVAGALYFGERARERIADFLLGKN